MWREKARPFPIFGSSSSPLARKCLVGLVVEFSLHQREAGNPHACCFACLLLLSACFLLYVQPTKWRGNAMRAEKQANNCEYGRRRANGNVAAVVLNFVNGKWTEWRSGEEWMAECGAEWRRGLVLGKLHEGTSAKWCDKSTNNSNLTYPDQFEPR